MAFENPLPTLNGVAPSWADIKTTFRTFTGIVLTTADYASIDSKTVVERGVQYGASGGRKMRTTTGQAKPEATVSWYRSGFQAMLRAFVVAAPVRGGRKVLGLVFFDLDVRHSVPNDPEIYNRKILGAQLNSADLSMTEGTDAEKVECALEVKEVVDVIDGVEVSLI